MAQVTYLCVFGHGYAGEAEQWEQASQVLDKLLPEVRSRVCVIVAKGLIC